MAAPVSVRSGGINVELDEAGKEFVEYKVALYVGRERVHTITGRYSLLRERYSELSALLPGFSGPPFPGRTGAGMTDENTARRSKELTAFFSAVLARRERLEEEERRPLAAGGELPIVC